MQTTTSRVRATSREVKQARHVKQINQLTDVPTYDRQDTNLTFPVDLIMQRRVRGIATVLRVSGIAGTVEMYTVAECSATMRIGSGRAIEVIN